MLAGSAPFLQAPGSCQMSLRSFGPTCRSLAEFEDEEETCVPPLHTVKPRHSMAGSTASFFSSYCISQGCRNGSPSASITQPHLWEPRLCSSMPVHFGGLCELHHFMQHRWPWKSTSRSRSDAVSWYSPNPEVNCLCDPDSKKGFEFKEARDICMSPHCWK